MKPKALIVDLDGTLALLDRDPYATELCLEDQLNIPVSVLLRRFLPDYKIIVVTGRQDTHRDRTEQWLFKHGIEFTELLMRPEGNTKVTAIELKKQIYNGYIFPKYDVLFALEDMFKVAEMYREQGVACFQVAKERFLK